MKYARPNSEHELLTVIEGYGRSLLYHALQPSILISEYALSAAINSLDIYEEEISTAQIGEAMAFGRYLHLDWQTYQYPYFLKLYPYPEIGYHVTTAYPFKLCWEELYGFQDMEQKGLCNIETILKRSRLL